MFQICSKKSKKLNKEIPVFNQRTVIAIFELLNRKLETEQLIRDLISVLREYSGIDAIAIRLLKNSNFPIFEKDGFSDLFMDSKSHVCIANQSDEKQWNSGDEKDLSCLCGVMLNGRLETNMPNRTLSRSYWINSSAELSATVVPKPGVGRIESRCHLAGYQSIALIPIKIKNSTIGLLQFHDYRKNLFNEELIIFFEKLADSIGIVVEREFSEQSLAERFSYDQNLQHSQKMETIGILAGGVAHDFNNLLHPILNYSKKLLQKGESDPSVEKYAHSIHSAAQRATKLVKQILTFGRKYDAEFQPFKLQYLVKEVLSFLRATLPTTIEIDSNLDSSSGAINGDASQIHQVVMNLVTNAYQAMEYSGGTLHISLENVDMTPDDLDLPENDNLTEKSVCLTIKDTGIGMQPEAQKRIFEPFVTTKERGKGTGLGLSVAKTIVKNHGGHIGVVSDPGMGTEFCVYFPRVEAPGELKSPVIAEEMPRGQGHILVVDDEETNLQLQKELIEELGYQVSTSEDGSTALRVFLKSPNAFDLVISDLTMPRLTGTQLVKKIREVRPDIPFILCTGYSDKVNGDNIYEKGIQKLLNKPVTQPQFAQAINEVLKNNERRSPNERRKNSSQEEGENLDNCPRTNS